MPYLIIKNALESQENYTKSAKSIRMKILEGDSYFNFEKGNSQNDIDSH